MKKILKNKKTIFVLIIVFLFILAFIVSKFFYQIMLIQGDSMKPTYHNLSFVIIDKKDKDFGKGDVIAFKKKGIKGVVVKRVIASPGDKVVIKDKKVYVNDLVSEDIRLGESINYAGIAQYEILLKEDEYFVMGDNYEESIDSRYEEIGLVDYKDIIGKILR